MKTYRVGFASLVHDHVWGEIAQWQKLPNVELVAVGDVNEDLRTRFKERVPNAKVYESWQAMLEAEGANLDIVQVASENNMHAPIVEAAAALGLHVIAEKPMAATYDQAKRMMAAVEKAGTVLMINWPIAWSANVQEFERRILAGDIGNVRYLKYRSAHNGPREIGCDPHFVEWLYDAEKNGAGAYMDYICYGAALLSLFIGRPEKVTGLRGVLAKDYPLPDDNAVVTVQYPHAVGVLEGSWTQVTGYVGPNLIAYGSEGAIAVYNGVQLYKPGKPVENLEVPATVAPRRSGPEYLIDCLEAGKKPTGLVSAEVCIISQEILQAGLIAADTGVTQTLPL